MKKFISLLLCFAVAFSMMSMLTVSATEMPEFVPDYYIVNIAHENSVVTENVVANGMVTVEGGWKVSTATADQNLGNGELLDYHYYTQQAGSTATYTFTNVPAGEYEVQYLVSHGNSYYYLPLEITINGATSTAYVGSTENTSNLTAGWHAVTTVSQTTSEDITIKLTVEDHDYASYQNVRTAAIRLKSLAERTEYVIRNSSLSGANSTNGTFEINGTWKEGSKNYNLDSVSGKQLYSTELGAYAKYNYINTDAPISIFGNDNYTGIEEGWYDVYFFYPQKNASDDPAANFEVYSNGETSTFVHNISTFSGAAWNLISDAVAPLYFTGDGSEYIKISNGTAGKYTRIGAIKLVKKIVINEEPDIDVKDLVSSPVYSEGTLTVVTNGSTVESGTKTVYALVAAYTDSEKLLADVKTTPIVITAGAEDTTVPVALPDVSGTSYKLFILESLANVKPLINNFDF